MTVVLFTHPACLAHDTGESHPECADRLRAVLRALDNKTFAPLLRESAPQASLDQLTRVHTQAYVDAILGIRPPVGASQHLDADTVMSAGSADAARHAAGGAVAAVDALMEGWARCAFVATRPPGHHAETAQAMGFSLFNNAAVAALHGRRHWNLPRVAVADFDAHHGNGTQAIFANDPTLFYASSHEYPSFPGTGHPDERGVADNLLNVPLAPGSGSAEFRAAWSDRILPALARFDPKLLIVSAGFDAHKADPQAHLRLETRDFGWITSELMRVSGDRLVSVLEGGYELRALAASVAAHVRGLMAL
jgi:acetoin utilization deacetylase AcuC-like enzyme